MAQKNQKSSKSTSKVEHKNITNALVYIGATFNNTVITLTDLEGNAVFWCSSGVKGFKGSRKSTPYAAKLVGEDVMQKAVEAGVKNVEIRVKGPGAGRESALRAIASSGLQVTKIIDTTPIPHNGCRPPKKRRI